MDVSEPVARTAFYCCVIRADDAASPRPVCGDTLAARFVDDDVRRDLARALRLTPPRRSNVARHRMVDDVLRERLASDPNRRILILGAGFDTRAFRLQGGRWFEIDDPGLLAFKEPRLPIADAPNALRRIPVVFGSQAPDEYLAPLAGDDAAVVVLEGVSMYLSDESLRQLATSIRRHLPNARLVCDLMTPRFARTYSRTLRDELAKLGARFGDRREEPHVVVEGAGYAAVQHTSIPGRAAQLDSIGIPRWVLNTVLRSLRDGYVLWVFDPA